MLDEGLDLTNMNALSFLLLLEVKRLPIIILSEVAIYKFRSK